MGLLRYGKSKCKLSSSKLSHGLLSSEVRQRARASRTDLMEGGETGTGAGGASDLPLLHGFVLPPASACCLVLNTRLLFSLLA